MVMTGAYVHPFAFEIVYIIVMDDRIRLHEVPAVAVRIVRGTGR